MLGWRKKRLVRLHFKTGSPSVDGIVYHYDNYHYYLQGARIISEGDETVPLDGATWWPRADVFHVQELEP